MLHSMNIVNGSNDVVPRAFVIESFEVLRSLRVFIDIELTVIVTPPTFYCVPNCLVYVVLDEMFETLLLAKVFLVEASFFYLISLL